MINAKHIRIVVQYMLARGCVKMEDLKELFRTEGLGDGMDESLQSINTKLNHYNIMIRSYIDPVTADKYYVLISKVDNHITQASSLYSPKNLQLFQLILRDICDNETGTISREDIMCLAARASIADVSILDDWLKKDWLMEVRDEYTLGPRSMAELDVQIPNFAEVSAKIVAARKR